VRRRVFLGCRFRLGTGLAFSGRFRWRGGGLGLDPPQVRRDGLGPGPDLILANGHRLFIGQQRSNAGCRRFRLGRLRGLHVLGRVAPNKLIGQGCVDCGRIGLSGAGLAWRRRHNVLAGCSGRSGVALRFRADRRRRRRLGKSGLTHNGIGDVRLRALRRCVSGRGGQLFGSRLGGRSRLGLGCICGLVVVDIGAGSGRLPHNRLDRRLGGSIDRTRPIGARVVSCLGQGRRGGLRVNGRNKRLGGSPRDIFATLYVFYGLNVAGRVGHDRFLGPRRYLGGCTGPPRCHGGDHAGNRLAPRGGRLGLGRPRPLRFGRLVATRGIVHLPFVLSRLYRCEHGTAK
jgi:hypothetical protein